MTNNHEKSSLRKIPNVGSQTEQDLIAMGYTFVESLKGKKAEDLYEEECRLRGPLSALSVPGFRVFRSYGKPG